MLGPWHLKILDGAIDRRHHHRTPAPRVVDVLHTRPEAGAMGYAIWPPIRRADQPAYARRLVLARKSGGALITVLHRRGATALVVVDVFGAPLTGVEQASVRGIFESLQPPGFMRMRPWGAIEVNEHGGFTTNAVERARDEYWWTREDRLSPALRDLLGVLEGNDNDAGVRPAGRTEPQ
jgi:hypothetical protein